MATENVRLMNIEEKLDFILRFESLYNDYCKMRKSKEDNEQKYSKKELDDEYNEQKFSRLRRIEEKLDFYLHKNGLYSEYAEIRAEREAKDLERRRKLAMLQDKNEFLRKRAIQHYANVKRVIGEPVLMDHKWIYIDPVNERIC